MAKKLQTAIVTYFQNRLKSATQTKLEISSHITDAKRNSIDLYQIYKTFIINRTVVSSSINPK